MLLVIGLALGRIGRAARHAELPPDAPNSPTAEPAVTAGVPGNVPNGATPGAAVPGGYPMTGQVVVPVPPIAGTVRSRPRPQSPGRPPHAPEPAPHSHRAAAVRLPRPGRFRAAR